MLYSHWPMLLRGYVVCTFYCLANPQSMGVPHWCTVYPKKYAHGFVVLCFVVVMQSFIMNSHEVFIHIHQGCFAGTGAIVRLPQCQWSKPDGYGNISQCITTTKHSKAKTVCIFLGIYCTLHVAACYAVESMFCIYFLYVQYLFFTKTRIFYLYTWMLLTVISWICTPLR